MAKPSSWQKHVWKWYKKLRNTLAAHSAEHALIKSLLYNIQVQLAELTMTNRIQPHPNPPYLKSDGTLNVSGQLKLFEAGTTTAKVAYKDVAGTSYGSTIDLNSSGLPEDGPIYWDITALYKVEIYTRVDDTPTYALDATVDNFGSITASELNLITSETSWTVDGVGATPTTFATLTEAMVASRNYVIMLDSGLTININNGTYTDDIPDFGHPQGQYLQIIGQSEAGVIFDQSTTSGTVFNFDNSSLGRLSEMTIKQADSNFDCIGLIDSNIARLSEITLDCEGTGANCLSLERNSYALLVAVTMMDFAEIGLLVTSGSRILTSSSVIIDNSATTGGTAGIYVDGWGSYVSTSSTTTTITGHASTKLGEGARASSGGTITLGDPLSVSNCTIGVSVIDNAVIIVQDASPTYTTNGADYSPSTTDRFDSIATNTSLRFIAT